MNKRAKKNSVKKRKNKKVVFALIVLILAGISIYTGYVYNSVKSYDNVIYPGVKVNDVDLSQKSKSDAIKILKEKYNDAILNKKINVSVNDKKYSLTYKDLNARFNIEDTVEEAFKYGKSGNVLEKYKTIKTGNAKVLGLKFSKEDTKVKELVDKIEKETNKNPKNATIVLNQSGTFVVTKDEKGAALKKDELLKNILDSINGDLGKDANIKGEVKVINANRTAEALNSINKQISTFSTSFGVNPNRPRKTNISIAANTINGTLLMPGESFSYNGVVGDTTADKGYLPAPVIVNNKIEQDYGGGVCQVSSTLYNALLRANILPYERLNHSLPVSYTPLGLDATVAYGVIDFKFKNPFDFPVYIQGYTTEQNDLVFNVYSNSSINTNRKYEPYSEVLETMQPKVQYVDDPNLPVGEEAIEVRGYTGYKVKSYLKIIENGNLIETKPLYTDTYKVVDTVIKRGTKKS